MTPGDGDLPSHKDAAPCSRQLPRPPAPEIRPSRFSQAPGGGRRGASPPRLAHAHHVRVRPRCRAGSAPRRRRPPLASFSRHSGSGGTWEPVLPAEPSQADITAGFLCGGSAWCVPPSSFSPPPPARPASRENQALFLARALPTVGTPAWQERPDAARQRLVPGPPSPHPARGGDTGDTAPDPRPPPGPGAACPQQPSKQGCPCPGEAPVTPPGLPTGRGAFRPTGAPRAAPGLRSRDPRAEGAGCGGSGRALRPA